MNRMTRTKRILMRRTQNPLMNPILKTLMKTMMTIPMKTAMIRKTMIRTKTMMKTRKNLKKRGKKRSLKRSILFYQLAEVLLQKKKRNIRNISVLKTMIQMTTRMRSVILMTKKHL